MKRLYADKKFTFERDMYEEKDGAYGFYVQRSDGVLINNCVVYFAKSILKVEQHLNGSITVTIPDWALKKKLNIGQRLYTGW